jgi:transcriptional regulator with XRE-family HTH domain
MRSLGEQLSTLREQQGLTQEEVAQRAHVPTPTIRRLEGGDRAYVRPAVLERIARALDVSLDVLLDWPSQRDAQAPPVA